MPAISLEDLQRQIADRERELKSLRQELESRQSHYTELMRRKEELQRQLRKIDAEIAALAAAKPAQTEKPKSSPPAANGTQAAPRLSELIVTILSESGKPMTARQLADETQRRGYQSSSRDPVKALEVRVHEMKKKGIVQRASGQPGYTLTGSGKDKSKSKSSTPAPAKKAAEKPAKPARRRGQPTLREVLTTILKSSRKPLSGSELAQRALASGYQTKSKTFVDSVWTLLGQMENVEHLPQQGYRLKKKS